MASYANKYFEEFIPEENLKEANLTQSPVSENMDTVKKLDDFLKDLLIEKKKTNEQNLEKIFEKLQNKTTDVTGSTIHQQNCGKFQKTQNKPRMKLFKFE